MDLLPTLGICIVTIWSGHRAADSGTASYNVEGFSSLLPLELLYSGGYCSYTFTQGDEAVIILVVEGCSGERASRKKDQISIDS
jgi:hypothetical protein